MALRRRAPLHEFLKLPRAATRTASARSLPGALHAAALRGFRAAALRAAPRAAESAQDHLRCLCLGCSSNEATRGNINSGHASPSREFAARNAQVCFAGPIVRARFGVVSRRRTRCRCCGTRFRCVQSVVHQLDALIRRFQLGAHVQTPFRELAQSLVKQSVR